VSLQVGFVNNSDASKSTNPFDFKLRDSAGVTHDIAFSLDPACAALSCDRIAER
jgi:hypothetical protein